MASNGIDDLYVCQNGKRLRCGYTTGTCAAAATKASIRALLSKKIDEKETMNVPKGVTIDVPIKSVVMDGDVAISVVVKDGGDDIDATHGMDIVSQVRLIPSGIIIDGGQGIGRVTKKGLDQPPGDAAINSTPRKMIHDVVAQAFDEFGYDGGAEVIISAPEGEKVALKTFNPNLGIVGGISVLGTSGIVEPMSEKAIIATIVKDMDMRFAEGSKTLVVVPGNYGTKHAESIPEVDVDDTVKCSNYIGEMLDHAVNIGADVILIGNIGKLVKLAGGIMNTHSKNADSRMEILSAYTALAGGSIELVRDIMKCISTDDALETIQREGLVEKVSELLMERIDFHMRHRTGGAIRTSAIMFSTEFGLLGKTKDADEMLRCLK